VRDANWSTFLEKGETITATRYVQTLNKVRRALREKLPKKKAAILQNDNVRPHAAHMTQQTIKRNGWELLSHPPYSPDLAPPKKIPPYPLGRKMSEAQGRFGGDGKRKNLCPCRESNPCRPASRINT
jgi:hypothetical protein